MSSAIGDISLKIIKSPFLVKLNVVPASGPLSWTRATIGLTASLGIGLIGWRKGSLSSSGVAGAVLTGTVTTGRGGYGRAALLVGFFAGSSLLSSRRWLPAKDREVASELPDRAGSPSESIAARGARRDIWQVVANGGVSTALAALGDSTSHRLAYTGSVAAVTGDTWATEIGSRLSSRPRHILSFQSAQPGVSGAVSLPGTIASVAGGLFIGVLAAGAGFFHPAFRLDRRALILAGVVTGTIGSLADSLIGATLQERRWCDRCEQPTERTTHVCGHPTRVTGGVAGLNNDVVNLLCSISGAMMGEMIERLSER